MEKQAEVTNGVVAFSNLTEHDVFRGKSTGKYGITIVLPEDEASRLSDMGVKLRTYQPEEGPAVKQRKFSTKFTTPVLNPDDTPYTGELPYGSKIKVAFQTGEMTPDNGLLCYLLKIRILELADGGGVDSLPEDF